MLDRLYMSASTIIRMGAGLLVFVLMARGLGPAAYGFVATVFAYATLTSLLTDFGFASKTLRDIGAAPERGGSILNASLSVKLYLTAMVALVGAVILALSPGDSQIRVGAGLLGAAVLIGAVGDLGLTAYRATGRYSYETWLTLWTSAIHLVLIGGLSLAKVDVVVLGCAFVVSRLAYAVIVILGAERMFSGYRLRPEPLREVWISIRAAWGWAADSGFSYVSAQIDTILVAALFGFTASGIYNAGARFTQVTLGVASILVNIHIPKLTKVVGDVNSRRNQERRTLIEFALVGVFSAVGIITICPILTIPLFGPSYSDLNRLWLGVGIFSLVRIMTAGLGAVLVSYNDPKTRVLGQLIGIVVTVSLILITKSYGYFYVPWAMVAGSASTMMIYSIAIIRFSEKAW